MTEPKQTPEEGLQCPHFVGTTICYRCAVAAVVLARKEGAEAFRKRAVRMADGFVPKCNDPKHDERWCSHCESMEDGVDRYAEEIGKMDAVSPLK